MIERKPHQVRAIRRLQELLEGDERRIVLTSPTGGGKTVMIEDAVMLFVNQLKKAVIYTNRKMLVEQISSDLDESNIPHGVRAAGTIGSPECLLQVASIQTEHARSPVAIYRRLRRRGVRHELAEERAAQLAWDLHDAGLVVFDEGHLHGPANQQSQRIARRHLDAGAVVLYVTATPLGLEKVADVLVQAGTTSELQACGMLARARHYGCDEPAYAGGLWKKIRHGGEVTEQEARKAVMTPGIYGRVLEHYRRINAAGRPTILFAPGVKESLWFAEQFELHGIPAAHIDGEEVWWSGHRGQSTRHARAKLLEHHKSGEIKVICTRFVLREGVNMPWVGHVIFATILPELQGYLQAGGRGLRAYPGLEYVTYQDHGGHWWRFGSLNDDRTWELPMTSRICAATRIDEFTDPGPARKPQPFTCPACKVVLLYREVRDGMTGTCYACGHEFDFGKRGRAVAQSDGRLVQMRGDVFHPREDKTQSRENMNSLWEICYWKAKSAKSKKWNPTFNQVYGYFWREYGYRPPTNLPLMPVRPVDWYYKVKKVPWSRLVPRPDKEKPARRPDQPQLFEDD